jgi:hypothetical protein
LLQSHLYLDVAIGLQHGFKSTLSVFLGGFSGGLEFVGSKEFGIAHGHFISIGIITSLKLSEWRLVVLSSAIVVWTGGKWKGGDSALVSLVLLTLLAVLVVSTSVSVYVSLSMVVRESVVTMAVRVTTVVVRLRSIVRSS